MTRIILIFLIMMTAFGLVWPQVGIQPSAFNVDFASYESDSAGVNLFEIYYQIYSSNLLHVRQDGKYVAKYSVVAIIRDGKKQITAFEAENTIYAESYKEAHNPKNYIVDLFKYYIAPGKYDVQVSLNDLNASSSIPLETEIRIPDYKKDRPDISQIHFARHIDEIGEESIFRKGKWRVIPSCDRRYGDDLLFVKFYYEYYDPGNLNGVVRFVYEIRDKRNKIVVTDAVDRERRQSSIGFIDSLNLESLKPGLYDLILYRATESKGEIVSSKGSFSINWSALQLVENDFDNAVEQLRYIATSKEMEKLKKTEEELRIKEWNKFWKSKDLAPDTEENELKDEYYRRIAFSNKKFEIPNKEGWKTDMGMVHIIHGQPDDIERHPFDIETKPYEIWYYYTPKRRFLFIDRGGYGEYVLEYPYDGDISKNINIYGGGR
ncbi:MAG: GWxTD domain-containing protein [candidate division Zixibacteria bacterium]|nr:GWxTD domain-containing protein [candidate division Zixibacteria bacterium]